MKTDVIYNSDARKMKEVDDESVHLIVTYPPYNVSKEYDEHNDLMPLDEYLELLNAVWKECKRILVKGGRICVNVANTGRKPYIPIHTYITKQLLDLGFLMRGEILWNKEASVGSSTAWGSWQSASNPTLRDVHEYVMVFSKDDYQLKNGDDKSDIERDEFLEWTKSIWAFPTISAKRVGHPAPFPEELPKRLIKLYSFPTQVILDPFVGSGTTCIAAKRLRRKYIGYDVSKKYCELAEERIKKEFEQQNLKVLNQSFPLSNRIPQDSMFFLSWPQTAISLHF